MNFLDMHVKIKSDVVFTVLDDEAVLLEQDSGKYFGLDSVGTRIWLLLSEHNQLSKVYELLLSEYEVNEGQLHDDLENLVNKLIENGLVEKL
jgi:hypothetical protein